MRPSTKSLIAPPFPVRVSLSHLGHDLSQGLQEPALSPLSFESFSRPSPYIIALLELFVPILIGRPENPARFAAFSPISWHQIRIRLAFFAVFLSAAVIMEPDRTRTNPALSLRPDASFMHLAAAEPR